MAQRFPRRILYGWFFGLHLLFVVGISAYVWLSFDNFKSNQNLLAERALDSAIRQISVTVDAYHRALDLFVVEDQQGIATLAVTKDEEEKNTIWTRVESKLAVIYTNPFHFFIADRTGEVKFISDAARFSQEELPLHALSHPLCDDYKEIQVLSTWGDGDAQGMFVVCIALTNLADIFRDNRGDGFSLQLMDDDLETVLTYYDEQLSTASPMTSQQFIEDIMLSKIVIGGPWRLVAIKNTTFHHARLYDLILNAVLAFVGFVALSGFSFLVLARVDRKRRLVETEMASLQARAQTTLASIADGVIVTDIQRNIEYMNPNAERMTGWRFEDADGLVLELVCPIDKAALKSSEIKTWDPDSPPKRFQIEIERDDGHKLVIEQSASLLKEADQKTTTGIVWVLRDISETQCILSSLAQSEEQYRLLAENVHDLIWTMDTSLNLTYISPSSKVILGVTPESIIESGGQALSDDDSRESFLDFCQQILASKKLGEIIELKTTHANGRSIWLEVNASVIKNSHGQSIGLLGVGRDITERRNAESEMRLSAIVFENSFEGILITDEKGGIVRVNKAFTKITGYLPEDVLGKNSNLLQSGRHSKEFFKEMWKSLVTQGFWHGEVWNRRCNGELYPQRLSISAIRDEHHHIINYIGIFADITDKKQSEERIHRLAYYDELSTLPNRVLFQERLKRALVQSRRNHTWVGLLFIDLDRFKTVNDTLGHPAGDELLQITAQRLRTCIREEDTVARMGGDEFTLILVNMQPESAHDGAKKVAEKVLQVVGEPYQLFGRDVFVGASVGIAFYPKDAEDLTDLVKNSDLALYHAKTHGRNNYQYFSENMNKAVMNRLELESDIRRALHADELKMYYQPQVSVDTGQLCGIEALIRWYSPSRGLVTPADFIPLAEETGIILKIGAWSLRKACEQAMIWQEKGYKVPKVAVNLSARQFSQPEMLDLVKAILTDTGLNPELLELELTESVLMEDIDTTVETLKELKVLGLSISIDDFGTGYSSLNYLKRFPLDRLKIDHSFVRDITTDPDDAEVIAAIIAIAHNLKLGVIAEGVETWGQLEFLRFHKCNEVQGYLISRPLTGEAMTELLASGEAEFLYQKFT